MTSTSDITQSDFSSDIPDDRLYTDFTAHHHFQNDEPMDHLYTDFTSAYISTPEYNIFLPISHDTLFQISQYYRSMLAWNHGIRSDKIQFKSEVSRVVSLPTCFKPYSIRGFIYAINNLKPHQSVLEDTLVIIPVCAFLGIANSWLASKLPTAFPHGYDYMKFYFAIALYENGYLELAKTYSTTIEYEMLQLGLGPVYINSLHRIHST